MSLVTGVFVFAMGGASPARAQEFPYKPVRVIGGLAPGGPADLAARIVAQALAQKLGQPFVVENKLGGGGSTAVLEVSRSTRDGYVLGAPTTGPLTILPQLMKNPPYKTLEAVTPVAQLAAYPYVLVVRKDLPVNSIAELLDYARKNPAKLSYGSGGVGTSNHIGMEWLKKAEGVHLLHIPYKGDNDIVRDLIGGRVDLSMNTPSVILAHIASGAVKPLAVTSANRLPILPQVQTMKEAGVSDFVLEAYAMLVAPAGTPPDVIARINREVNDVLQRPEVKDRMIQSHMYTVVQSPDGLRKYIEDQQALWSSIIHFANIPLQ